MAGIIESEQQDITPEGLRGQMQVPPEKMQTYQAVVAAAKKIMYSPQMDDQVRELMAGEGDMGTKLGTGVMGLMALVMDKAGGAIPPDLVIPAGLELVAEAGKFMKDAGAKVDKNDIAEGMAVFVEQILQRAGVSLDQLPQMLGQQGGAPEAGAAPEPAEVEPEEEVK